MLYLLSAIVCHYGGHAFGHYICYRRKPRPTRPSGDSSPNARFRPRTLDDLSKPGTGHGWLRLSDHIVDEVGIETVLSEQGGVFMAFYELADVPSHNSVLKDALDVQVDHHGVSHDARSSPSRILREIASGLEGLSSRASTPRVVQSVSTGMHTFSRPRTRETSPRRVLRSSISEAAAEDGQILSASTDASTPFRTSKPANKLAETQPAEEVIQLPTITTFPSPSHSHASDDLAASTPRRGATASKKRRSRHRRGKSKGRS